IGELEAIRAWVAEEQPPHRRAAVLVGSAGRGKSELLRAFAGRCEARGEDEPLWFVELARLTGSERPAASMENLLRQIHSRFHRLVAVGPDDLRPLRSLARRMPTIGYLLEALSGEDTRPAWERFVYFAQMLHEAARPGERFVFL